jgi:hypothetical protein
MTFDFHPLNLVLAEALAWASIFIGYLPTRVLRAPGFTRQVLWAGLAWMAVAILSPGEIRHFHVLIGLVCLIAWWKLRADQVLGGKLWFAAASGLGISLGVVLILAVTPQGLTLDPFGVGRFVLFSCGGAVIGLAYALYVCTRRQATNAGISSSTVDRLANLLFVLTLVHAVGLFLLVGAKGVMNLPGPPTPAEALLGYGWERMIAGGALAGALLVVPGLALVARRRSGSPAPSSAGASLLALCAVGLLSDALLQWLAI